MLEKELLKYSEMFNDNFPIFSVISLDEKEIIELIKKSLKNNEPYVDNYKDKVDY